LTKTVEDSPIFGEEEDWTISAPSAFYYPKKIIFQNTKNVGKNLI
jgi:hypothetical protein